MNGITRRFYLVNQADINKLEKLENASQIPDLVAMQIPKINLVNIISSYFPLERDWTMQYARDNLAYTASHFRNVLDSNSIYWNNEVVPQQIISTVNIFQAELTLNLAYRNVHLDNYFVYQKSSNTNIRVPEFYLKNSLYYERPIFKKAMLFRIGLDSRFIGSYYANAYQPLLAQFYNQDILKMRYTPMIDVFINAKIKTVRIFLKGNNLLQGVGQKGSYNAFLYPSDERSFKFGVTWRFLD